MEKMRAKGEVIGLPEVPQLVSDSFSSLPLRYGGRGWGRGRGRTHGGVGVEGNHPFLF